MLEELKQKVEEFMNSGKVQSAINTAKEKAEELKNNEKVQAAVNKVKEKADEIKNNEKVQSAMAKAKERWNIEKDNLYVQKAEAKLRMTKPKGKPKTTSARRPTAKASSASAKPHRNQWNNPHRNRLVE